MKMPGDMLPVMLTTGVGMGVLAGVVSGVCFLVYNGYSWAKRVKHSEELRSEGNLNTCSFCKSESNSLCSSCCLPTCIDCASKDSGSFRCQPCGTDRLIFSKELEAGNPFLKNLKSILTLGSWSKSNDNLNRLKLNSASGAITPQSDSERDIAEEGRRFRDFLQKLSERLAGGSLDDVNVNKMYQHPEYLPLTDGETVTGSHAKLQQLVQRIIEEALKLPALLDYSGVQRNPDGSLPEFSPKTYEDLLATAILNKVIDRYQNDVKRSNGASSSGVHSGSSSPGELDRGRRRRQQKRDSHQPSPSPSPSPEPSSLEPMSQDEYARSDSSGHVSDTPPRMQSFSNEKGIYTTDDEDEHYRSFHSNPVDGALSNMNFSHKNRIIFPEYGGDIIEHTENDHIYNDDDDSKMANGNVSMNSVIRTNNDTWEENWLFQKKKIKTSQSVPVPMLIPNSNTEYRVLIGDRDADDTTDLSDLGSDAEETPSDIKHVLINSKTIIGGKNPDIILALVDQDDSPNDATKDSDNENGKLDVRIDEESGDFNDDNFILVSDVVEENNNTVTRKTGTESERLSRAMEEREKEDGSSRHVLKSFLKSLDSDNEESEHYYGRSSSMMSEDDVFSERNVTEATNLDVIDGKDELAENLQKESEYTETVTVPVQRHMDSLKRQHYVSPVIIKDDIIEEDSEPPPLPPTPAPMLINNNISIDDEEIIIQFPTKHNNTEEFVLDCTNDQILQPIYINGNLSEDNSTNENSDLNGEDFPVASIAEREHKKWLNAVPMANNPYSPEAIQSRLNKPKQSSLFDYVTSTPKKEEKLTMQTVLSDGGTDYKRYGRDYYINDAKKSTGTRKRNKDAAKYDSCPDEMEQSTNGDSSRRTSPSSDTTPSAPTKIAASNAAKNHKKKTPSEKIENVYSAKPALVENEDVDSQFEEIYKNATKFDEGDRTIYVLPVDLNDENTRRLARMTNGIILQDSLDQSDSISSADDAPRIYNVDSGTIVRNAKSKLFRNANDEGLKVNDANKCTNQLPDEIKEELVDLPSVKAIAKRFFAESKQIPATEKPKRRISKEILENEIVNKTLSNSHVKQPLHMHSITARSISKEFRDELKLSKPTNAITHPVSNKSINNIKTKDVHPVNQTKDHIPETGSLKNKLAFFENISRQP